MHGQKMGHQETTMYRLYMGNLNSNKYLPLSIRNLIPNTVLNFGDGINLIPSPNFRTVFGIKFRIERGKYLLLLRFLMYNRYIVVHTKCL